MTEAQFGQLLQQRWEETCLALGTTCAHVTWEIGGPDSYPHFKKKRGYGVTFGPKTPYGSKACRLLFARKILRHPLRADGVIRHELGHVVDMTVDPPSLNDWAQRNGHRLPATPERRADAIAEVIWRDPIRYDLDLVQTTGPGRSPRPLHLGL